MKDTDAGAPQIAKLHSYDYEIDLNGDNALAYVVAMAGSGRKILELGAGSGMQTQFLVRDNSVVAADINPESVEKLRKFTPDALCVDLNAPDWTKALQAYAPFDTIIAADVLEHLYDPWTTLDAMKSLLAQDGEIIVSVPYIGNAAILGLIYDDDFQYRESGLLDKTHIRFFGLRNIVQMYDNAGLKITEARCVVIPPHQTEFHAHWNKLPKVVRSALTVGPHSDIYQVVTKTRRAERVSQPVDLFAAATQQCAVKPQPTWRRLASLLRRPRG
ncbi:MAG: class I SAM-dependent methyltransferase [Hyphomicrobiales bacterium]|nr:class I SAM-dependent methyltransferase [Hyphomicrobiales bacterium]